MSLIPASTINHINNVWHLSPESVHDLADAQPNQNISLKDRNGNDLYLLGFRWDKHARRSWWPTNGEAVHQISAQTFIRIKNGVSTVYKANSPEEFFKQVEKIP